MLQINLTTPNLTGVGQQKPRQLPLCWSYLTAELHSQLTFISVLNSFLSVTALFGNALILIALSKESSLHPPSKLLLRSLATTDLGVGLISEPLTIIYWMSEVNEHKNICVFVLSAALLTGSILCSISLLTLTAICVDRLLALLFSGTEIQTSCNFKANQRYRCYHLDCVRCLFRSPTLESRYQLMVLDYSYTTLYSNLSLLLHKDFLHPSSSSKSSARPCSTTEPNKSTERSTIQKGSVHCNMAATDAGRLLSSLWCNCGFVD